jgi:hypothetical protein
VLLQRQGGVLSTLTGKNDLVIGRRGVKRREEVIITKEGGAVDGPSGGPSGPSRGVGGPSRKRPRRHYRGTSINGSGA